MKYNPDIHHRRSIRFKGYDYSQAGLYFVTVCTQTHFCLFGEIENGVITLNKYGKIVQKEWIKTSDIRPNIQLDAFIVMPNHIHGIIFINDITDCRGTMHRAPTVEQFGKPTSNTIPTIIRGYKSSVTKQINVSRNTPGVSVWQRNYYEHIIRNEKSFHQIVEYINHNPVNWQDDSYYSE